MKFFSILIFLLTLSSKVQAEQFYGVGAMYLKKDGSRTKTNATVFTVGYKYGERNFTLTPLFKYLKANSTYVDELGGSGLTKAAMFNLKAQYQFDHGTYLFVSPVIGSFTYEGIGFYGYRTGSEEDEFEAGLNFGLGFEFSKYISTDLTIDVFQDSRSAAVGIYFRF